MVNIFQIKKIKKKMKMVFLFYRRNFKSMTSWIWMQLRFGIDIDGARPLSVGKYNSKYSAANLQASLKEEATEVGADILNKK